jgi:hypothetical protein
MPRVSRGIYVPLAPVLHVFGSRSGTSHLLHAPIANPSETAIRTVQIFRMRATPPETQYGKSPSDAATRRLRIGQVLFWCRRAVPSAVSTIREVFMAPPFSMRTNPWRTASSQIDIRGQVLRHASMVSP